VAYRTIQLIVPQTIWERLDKVSKETGMTIHDIIMRAIVKVIEEFGG